jgi:Tfp pilus assembly protein PilV
MEGDASMARDQTFNSCVSSSIRNQDGFSLIECLIYGAITTLLSIVLFTFFNSTTSSLHVISDREYDSLASWTAHQLLDKDMQMADANDQWWHIESNLIICRITNECIGWQLHKGSLYRLKGVYDFNSGQWENKSSALVIQKMKHFRINLNEHEKMISSVRYELETEYDKQIKTISLENRRI